MRKVKLIYVDGENKHIQTEKTEQEILKQCTYENFSDSFKYYVSNKELNLSNQIKAVDIEGNIHLFRYDEKQEFYVHF